MPRKKLLRDKETCTTEGTHWSLQLQALTFCSIWALEYNVSPHSSLWQTSWSTWWRGHHSLCVDVKRPSFVSISLCTGAMYLTLQMPSSPCFYYGSFKLYVLTVKKISMSSSEPSRLNMFHIEMWYQVHIYMCLKKDAENFARWDQSLWIQHF